MKLLFATSNQNKAIEIAELLPSNFKILTLKDINHFEDVPETSDTIQGNACQKANFIKDKYALDCFADDTGLEVLSLDGDPGVRSARYAGEHRSDSDNIQRLQERLHGKKDRTAQFRTVICLALGGIQLVFEGTVKGRILEEPRGHYGFGYDPIFEPENCGKSFAEMTIEEKNFFSHRARAFTKMIEYLISTNVSVD